MKTSSELRISTLQQLKNMSADDYDKASDIICNKALTLIDKSYSHIDSFLCFYPTNTEPNLLPLYELLLSRGKKLFFPVCISDSKMNFYPISDLSDFTMGMYGIYAPKYNKHTQENSWEGEALCLTPGVVFDSKNNNRIGHGKGYYDRFFSEYSLIKIGIGFNLQLKENIPTNDWDVPLDYIITN